MAQPSLTGASFAKLTKDGTSNGTVTGTNFSTNAGVSISTKNGKKTWGGTVGTNVSGNTWNASVTNKTWSSDPVDTEETVTVVVSSGGQDSNPVDTQSDIP
jgi:hypothetical protein